MSKDLISKIIPVIVAVVMLVYAGNNLGWFGLGNGEAEKAAEAYVNKQVYSTLGVPAKNYSSEVIYNEDGNKLIVVKYSLENNSNWGGACCVHYKDGVVWGSTTIMPPAYDFKANIDESMALFGIY